MEHLSTEEEKLILRWIKTVLRHSLPLSCLDIPPGVGYCQVCWTSDFLIVCLWQYDSLIVTPNTCGVMRMVFICY